MSNFLRLHGLQHARLLCPSLSPRVCSNSCPLSQWCYPTISPSATPFYFCLQSVPESGSFPKNWLFTSGGQSIGASVSASVLPMNILGWFLLGLTGWYPSSSLTLGFPIIPVDHFLSPCNHLLQVIAMLTMPPQMWTQVPPQKDKRWLGWNEQNFTKDQSRNHIVEQKSIKLDL